MESRKSRTEVPRKLNPPPLPSHPHPRANFQNYKESWGICFLTELLITNHPPLFHGLFRLVNTKLLTYFYPTFQIAFEAIPVTLLMFPAIRSD